MVKINTESSKKTLQVYSILEVLDHGLELACRLKPKEKILHQSLQDASHTERVAAYKAMYGPKPDVTGKAFVLMQTADTPEAEIDVGMDQEFCLDNLHTTLYLVKHLPKYYELETVLFKSRTTITKWVHFFIRKVQALKVEKFAWPESLNKGKGDVVTVSTFKCAIRSHHHSAMWNAHELAEPAFAYEVARSSFDDKVIWMKGPYPGGASKSSVYHASGLCDKIMESDVIGLGDNWYIGEPTLKTPGYPGYDDDHSGSVFWWQLLSRHEKFFHEMRQYKILDQKYYHSERMHKAFFEAIVVLCQMDLDAEPEV